MDDQIIYKKKDLNLEKEQEDLILFMEFSMQPELLDAVQRAYKTKGDDTDIQESLNISYEGTQYA